MIAKDHLPPKNTRHTIHKLPTGHIWPIASWISTFPGGGGWVVIIKVKANLSSTGTGLPTGTELGKNEDNNMYNYEKMNNGTVTEKLEIAKKFYENYERLKKFK